MRALFSTTNDALDEIGKLYDFLWPTAIALWNLRWQVQGFVDAVPDATDQALVDRFASHSGIRGGSLRRACVQTSWEGQQTLFAEFLLASLCAIFESWCDDIAALTGENGKDLQFPSHATDPKRGIGPALSRMRSQRSPALTGTFHPILATSAAYSLPLLENLLRCYRYFKEVRNALTHSGGIASTRTCDAFAAFAPVATLANLGVAEVPQHYALAVGTQVRLSLRGVVGLSDVLRRIMLTVDAEISETAAAQQEIASRASAFRRKILSGDPAHRRRSIGRILKDLRFPPAKDLDRVGDVLKSTGAVFY